LAFPGPSSKSHLSVPRAAEAGSIGSVRQDRDEWKIFQPSIEQQTAVAALARGMLGYFIILDLRRDGQREWREEGDRHNVAWKIVCYDTILAPEP